MTTLLRVRGRPREFELDAALAAGQQLFHALGYQAVGVAALTQALKIAPPSFYKAFGSKAEYFEAVLNRYSASVLPLEPYLRAGRPVREGLTDLLRAAARTYGKTPATRGCLVLESVRGDESQEEVVIARRIAERRRRHIKDFVARENKSAAGAVTDYVVCIMSGLSASAREGASVSRLLSIAGAASAGLASLLRGDVA